jgi:pimeloyl-ACP methyl ester carboxylesterase
MCYMALVKHAWWPLALAGGLIAFSLWTFWLAVRPPRIAVPGTPGDHGLPFQELAIAGDDGVRLAAWLIPARAPGGPAVILLHGYPAEKADLLPIAAALHPAFTTLAVDLRYFGRSEGRATTLGGREGRDLRGAVDLLAARGFTRIGVFGYSLGGAVALLGAAGDSRIAAVAAYAPFADLRLLGRDLYAVFWVLKYPLVELMRGWAWLVFGADITRPSPAMAAAALTIPVLLMASRDDEQIPFRHAERLAAALAQNPRAEIQIGRGRHNERAPDFERRLVEFFTRHLSPRTEG